MTRSEWLETGTAKAHALALVESAEAAGVWPTTQRTAESKAHLAWGVVFDLEMAAVA